MARVVYTVQIKFSDHANLRQGTKESVGLASRSGVPTGRTSSLDAENGRPVGTPLLLANI
jgi:hypothetical protein